MRWEEFERDAAELSQLAKERFAATELAMLGTLRKNGWPRITPIEYTFFEGDLMLGGMWQSKKCLDLLRDPRCVLHNTTSNKNGQEGDIKIYGRVVTLDAEREERYWQHIFEVMHFRPDGPAHVFALDIESAAYVAFSGDGTMRWLTWPGNDWRTKKSS
ncbi:MAG: pyridoxamine 5'-phosphate oxidase family protein [Dehalococcoidia bacterium]